MRHRRQGWFVERGQDCTPPEDQALEQRVGRESVGAVDAGGRAFAGDEEARQIGPPFQIGNDAADRVVRGRRDRDRLVRRIEAGSLDLHHEARKARPVDLAQVQEGRAFGHDRSGDLELLHDEGLLTRLVEPVAGVSSTAIRDALHKGDVITAASLLGHPYELDGRVVPGFARGARLGFPTANLVFAPHQLVPLDGIYAGFSDRHRAAVSIGVNVHFKGAERRVEVHLIDFAGDLYGKRLVVELWQQLRDERAFESDEALIEQIARDVEAVREAEPPGQPLGAEG